MSKLSSLSHSSLGDWLVVAAGAALPIAFAPFHVWGIAFLSLGVLFYFWLGIPPRWAAWRGWLFGLGMFSIGTSWVFVSMYEHGGVPLVLSLSLTSLLVVVMALFPALAGYLSAKLFPGMSVRSVRWKLLLLFPAMWTAIEWVRGWFLTGFPWLNVGYGQIDGLLAGYGPLIGVYGMSFLTAISSGALALAVTEKVSPVRIRVLASILGIWLVGWGLHYIPWTKPTESKITVSLIQGNISQDLKWLSDMRQPTIEHYVNMSRSHWDSDLIVWPETALPDFYHRQKEFLDGLAEQGRDHDTDFLIGVLYMDTDTERYYNSVVAVGSHSGFYHKHHLVPFTEYLPLKGALGPIVQFMRVPMSDFSSGDVDQKPLIVANTPVAVSICFEDAFGEEMIRAIPEAQALVNVSNDAWFGDSLAPHQHLQMAAMRALETGRPMLRATNTGITAIVNHKGRILAASQPFTPEVVTAAVQPMRGTTPYAVVGNYLVVTVLFVSLAVGGFLLRRWGGTAEDILAEEA